MKLDNYLTNFFEVEGWLGDYIVTKLLSLMLLSRLLALPGESKLPFAL